MNLPPIDPGQQGRLSVDLKAICANYKTIAQRCAGSETAAVIKADAYGLGVENVSQALEYAGCKTFFVATLFEAEQLRYVLPEATIYILNGVNAGGMMRAKTARLRPVLNSVQDVLMWAQSGAGSAAVHLDTGMNRLGIRVDDFMAMDLPFEPALLMTHFASADDLSSQLTDVQAQKFRHALAEHPALQTFNFRTSLANSAGCFHHSGMHGDVVRPGIGLFGGLEMDEAQAHLQDVVKLEVSVLQLRQVPAGESVGYAQGWIAPSDSTIATLSVGYADGFARCIGGSPEPYDIYFEDYALPVIGRVSMDLVAVDISSVPQGAIAKGTMVEVIGKNNNIIQMAKAAQTIPYEILTSFGFRYERLYMSPR